MTVIQVNPQALNTYGSAAGTSFGVMAANLGSIVADVNSLQYAGANAKSFKDACGETATTYVTFMNKSLTEMANAIMAATRNIEQSLGGGAIHIQLDPVQVDTAVNDASADTVVLDQDQLDATKSNIEGYFNQLLSQLEDHKKAFDAAKAEWTGRAADVAAQAVTTTTVKAIEETENAKTAMVNYMQSQQESATTADMSLQAG